MAEIPLSPKELKEAQELAKKLGLSFDVLKSSASNVRKLIQQWREELNNFGDDTDYVYDQLTKITDQFKRSNSYVKNINKGYNSLTSIAQDLQSIGRGSLDTSLKELKIFEKKVKLEQDRITSSTQILQNQLDSGEIPEQQKILVQQTLALEKQRAEEGKSLTAIIQGMTAELNEQKKIYKDQNELLGLGGHILEGMDVTMEHLGLNGLKTYFNIDKARESMEKLSLEIANGSKEGNKFSVFGAGLKELSKGFTKILDPLVLFSAMVKGFAEVDEAVGELNESLGLSYNEGKAIASEMNTIANETNDVYMTSLKLTDSYTKLTVHYGNVARLSEESLVTFSSLTKQVGLSEEAAIKFDEISRQIGKGARETTAEFEGQLTLLNYSNDTAFSYMELMESIKGISSATLMSLGNQPKKIAEAAYEAKKLGLTMNEINSVASSLLDFESSISNEIEAELLTGKQLNLEQARYYALTNDVAGLSKELAKNIGTSADFTRMNVFEQDALAKSMGLSRDQLADTLKQQDLINDLKKQGSKYNETDIRAAISKYGYDKAALILGEGRLEQQEHSESVQKRLAASMSKFADVLFEIGDLFAPIISGLTTVLGYLAAGLSYLNKWHIVTVGIAGLFAIKIIPALVGAGSWMVGLAKSAWDWAKGLATGVKSLLSGDFKSILYPTKSKVETVQKTIQETKSKIETVQETKSKVETVQETIKETKSKADEVKGGGEKTKSTLTNLGAGLKEMSGGKVTQGILNLALAGPALLLAIPSIPFLLFMGKVELSKLANNFSDLGSGLKGMSDGKITAGILNLALAGPALLSAVPSIPFLLFVGKAELSKLVNNFFDLGSGLKEMSGVKTTMGIGNLALFGFAAISAVASVPFLLFMGKIELSKIESNLSALGKGLMSLTPAIAGVGVLAAFAVAGVLAIPSLVFLGGIALIGKAASIGLEALGGGLKALGAAAGEGFIGVALIGALGLAMIPFGYALNLATPAITAFGDIILGVFGALPAIITAVADAFATIFTTINLSNITALFALGPALLSASFGMTAFAASIAIGGLSTGLFGGGLLGKVEKLANMAAPISIVAVSIKQLSDSIKELNISLNQIDPSKLESLNDIIASSSINTVAKGVGSVLSAPLEMIHNLIGGDKSQNDLSYQELKEIKELLNKILHKSSDIKLDGNKVGTVLSTGMATYRTQ